MFLPDGNDMLSDWLKAKFRKGTVPNTHPGSKVIQADLSVKAFNLSCADYNKIMNKKFALL